MKRLILLISLILSTALHTYAFTSNEYNSQDLSNMNLQEKTQYVKQIKTLLFAKDCKYKLETPEFIHIIATHRKDKQYPDQYYAAQTGYDSYNNADLTAMFTKHMNIMYMYGVQEKDNSRIIYYYNVFGSIQLLDFMYENYPNYPFYTRKYKKSGDLINSVYCPDEKTKIKFNTKGTKAEIWINEELTDKINF